MNDRERDRLKQQLARDTEAYIRAGGKITKVPPGVMSEGETLNGYQRTALRTLGEKRKIRNRAPAGKGKKAAARSRKTS